MYVISIFQYSISLEKAITSIQMKGVAKENILAVPMDRRSQEHRLLDTINYSDGLSLFDVPCMLGSLLSLFGGIYGFVLEWGPIIWGLIGMVSGIGIGFIIKLAVTKRHLNSLMNKAIPEVVLIIECKEEQVEDVKKILWEHNALGVRKLQLKINK